MKWMIEMKDMVLEPTEMRKDNHRLLKLRLIKLKRSYLKKLLLVKPREMERLDLIYQKIGYLLTLDKS